MSDDSLMINLITDSGDILVPEEPMNPDNVYVAKDWVSSGDFPCVDQNMLDPYLGKDVFLSIEGGQKVFYRGAYVTRIALNGNQLLFGRRDVMAGHYPDVDLAMYWKMDRAISRRHFKIYRNCKGAYILEDLCNNNTTFINSYEHPINRNRCELKHGDRILVSRSIAIVFCVV